MGSLEHGQRPHAEVRVQQRRPAGQQILERKGSLFVGLAQRLLPLPRKTYPMAPPGAPPHLAASRHVHAVGVGAREGLAVDGAQPLEIKRQAGLAKEPLEKGANLLPLEDAQDGVAVRDGVPALHKGQAVRAAIGVKDAALPRLRRVKHRAHAVQVLQHKATGIQDLETREHGNMGAGAGMSWGRSSPGQAGLRGPAGWEAQRRVDRRGSLDDFWQRRGRRNSDDGWHQAALQGGVEGRLSGENAGRGWCRVSDVLCLGGTVSA